MEIVEVQKFSDL